MSKIIVVAHATAKPGKEKELRKILLGFLTPTRKEKGCLLYDLHESSENSQNFVFYEEWTDQKSLDLHLQTPHIKSGAAQASSLLAQPIQITLWRKIE